MKIWSAELKEIERLFESFKVQIPELGKELEQLIRSDDPNVLLLYSRRCLEVIITDLCVCELKRPRKSEPLKGIIDKLNKEEKVPSHIITSMDHVNGLSTYGAHPKDFDPEQVKPVLSNLAIIIKWYQKYKDSQAIGKEESGQENTTSKHTDIPADVTRKSKKNFILIVTSILLIIAVIIFPKIFRRDKLANMRSSDGKISVAVMPFQNMTNDTTWNIWQDGIQDMIITTLSNSEELSIRQAESINTLIQSKGLTNYASITPFVASSISQKLDANVFVCGSLKKAGATIRLNAQLIDSKTEEVFKSFQIEAPYEEENIFHLIDSLSTMAKNYLIISVLEKIAPIYNKRFTSTNSPEAFRYFIYGRNEFMKRDYTAARKWLLQAISVDSSFVQAITQLSLAYGNQRLYDQAKKWCLRAYEKRDLVTAFQKIDIERIYATYFETPHERIICLKQLIEFDDQWPVSYYNLGLAYHDLYQYDNAIPEYEKALEIHKKWDTKPYWVFNYTYLGTAYHKTGQYKKEKELYKKAEQDFPEDLDLLQILRRQGILALSEGDSVTVRKTQEKAVSIFKSNSYSEANIMSAQASVFADGGDLDKAEKYYQQALSLEPEKHSRMNNLALFLIKYDRNIDEGLELDNKALGLSPDNYLYLDCKGWGLYKQGKYKEALEVLERSWELMPVYNHEIYLHLEEVKKAVARQKNN